MENTNRLILEKLSSNEMLLKISSKEENIKITSLFCSLPFMSQLSFDIGHDLIKGVIATMLMSDIKKEEIVIEIGPGLGTLTKYLLERAGKVLCVELDTKMIKILN